MNAATGTAAALAALLILSACAPRSPYAGQQQRGIKALSASEIEDYLQGKGMGFAKPAELNGYPGPMHVLELADKLGLSSPQREATQQLMQRHKAEVRDLGKQFVEAEAEMEQRFAARTVDGDALAEALRKSADLQRRIRESHLSTHLKQTALLTTEQLGAYVRLRGYVSHDH